MYRATLLCLLVTATCSGRDTKIYAQAPPSAAGEDTKQIVLEAFIRSDLPAAAEVAAFLADLGKREPGIAVAMHDVLKDREQLLRLHELTRKFGRTKAVVPSFHCCNRMFFGFTSAEKNAVDIDRLRTVDIYTRVTCPRCTAAKAFMAKIEARWPGLKFVYHDVDANAAARLAWEKLCRTTNQIPGLPTVDFAGQVLVGYQGDNFTGAQYERLIEKVAGTVSGRQAEPHKDDSSSLAPLLFPFALVSALEQPPLTSGPHETLDELTLPSAAEESETGEGTRAMPDEDLKADVGSIRLPYWGTVRVADLGFPAFTLAVGLVDGFNPCAMWILVFLLSVLVNIRDRRKILLIAGHLSLSADLPILPLWRLGSTCSCWLGSLDRYRLRWA